MRAEKNPLPPVDINIEQSREATHRKMFSKVSHDLRTPLSLMIGSLEIYERMKDKLTDEKKESLIELALQESYRLDNFITNILDMESLEHGKVAPHKDTINLNSLLEECVSSFSMRIKSSHIRVAPAKQDVVINSDRSMITRVIKALLDNAIKYAGKTASIILESEVEGDQAVIKIHDNGPGIPAEQWENVFSKYIRLEIDSQPNTSVGLGLTICREIISMLGGTITASHSDKHNGALFTIKLPLS